MPFCAQCGTQLEGRFCHNCGAASTHAPDAGSSQQTSKLESSGSSLVGSVEYHSGYDDTAAGPATGSATEKFVLDERSSKLVRAAGFWWLAGLVVLALFVYVLTLMMPVELSPLTTSDQAAGVTVGIYVGRIIGASLAMGLFGLLTWWLLHAVRRGSNLSRRILQIGWPLYGAARGLYEFFSYAAAGMTALAIADLLVFGTILLLWVRMALLLSGVVLPTRSVPHPNRPRRAGEQGPVVVFRTEIPAFVATAILVIVAIIQLAHDLKK